MKTGSGLTHHTMNRKKKYVSIDFAGNDEEQCYRNDASVLFFAANSYWAAHCILAEELDNRFTMNVRDNAIEHMIMPYYFTFRHYVELYLKALYICIKEEQPNNIHDIKDLLIQIQTIIKDTDATSNDKLLLSAVSNLKRLITSYGRLESAVEYYRYIFDKNYNLPNSKLSLDLPKTQTLFLKINKKLYDITNRLREDGFYVYNFL